jgi:hypothetical protein
LEHKERPNPISCKRPNPNKTPKAEKTLLLFAYINKLVRSVASERTERESNHVEERYVRLLLIVA